MSGIVIFRQKCYGSKINKDKLIKVTVGLAEPMGEGGIMELAVKTESQSGHRCAGGSRAITRSVAAVNAPVRYRAAPRRCGLARPY
jgi:hypothetical protein